MCKEKATIGLGKELTRAEVNLQRVILETIVKSFIICLVIYAGIKGHPVRDVQSFIGAVFFCFVIVAMLGWGLWPLVHSRDYMVFYDNGIEFCHKRWSFEELGEIYFSDVSSNVVLFTKNYMETDVKVFNITYLKDGRKKFNRAYYKTI